MSFRDNVISVPGYAVNTASPADVPVSPSEDKGARRPLWKALGLLAAFTLVCFAAHQGGLLTIAFTPLALVAGYSLLRKQPALYVGFTLWLWCYAPLVRRLADYVSGYRVQSPVLLAPVLVSLLGLTVVWKKRGDLFQARTLVFLLPAAGILYGLLLGAVRNPITTTATVGLRWLVPICFGLFLYFAEDENGTLAQEFRHTLVLAATIAAAYGLYQYVRPPAWDTYWLTNVSVGMVAPSFGTPEPYGIRVFGPLYAPGLFAGLMACGLLLLVGQRARVLAIAAPLMGLALMLTKIRTAWLGVALGLLYLLVRSEPQRRFRLALTLVAVGLLFPLAMGVLNPSSDVGDRMSSFSNLKQDESAQSRAGGLGEAMDMIVHEPLGKGLGYLDSDAYMRSKLATRYEVAAHDLGVLEVPLELGLLGAGLYLAGMLLAMKRVAQVALRGNSPVIVGLITMCVSFFAYTPTSNALIYFDGVLFWSATSLLLHRNLEIQDGASPANPSFPLSNAIQETYSA